MRSGGTGGYTWVTQSCASSLDDTCACSPESEAPEKTATDPLSDAFEEHLEEQQQTDEATDQAPDDATEQAHPEEPTLVVDTQTNNLVEPEDQTFDTPREQQTPEVAPAPKSELAPEPLTLVQSAEPTPAPNPAAVSGA